MFEVTNVESPTHHEKLDVALKTVVKRNAPYTNLGGREINSVTFNSFAEPIFYT